MLREALIKDDSPNSILGFASVSPHFFAAERFNQRFLRRKLDFCRRWPNCLRSMTGMALARFEM